MVLDPATAALIAGGANMVGGIFNANAQKTPTRFSENLEQMLGQRGLDIQSAAVGDQIRRQLESMPARDRALYMMQARMGQSPGRFQPGGVFQQTGQTPSQGGIDMGAMQDAAKAYTPGAGGTRPDIAGMMMGRLGYTPGTGSFQNAPGLANPWQKSLYQNYELNAPRNWANTTIGTESGGYQQGSAGSPAANNPNTAATSQGVQDWHKGGLLGDQIR